MNTSNENIFAVLTIIDKDKFIDLIDNLINQFFNFNLDNIYDDKDETSNTQILELISNNGDFKVNQIKVRILNFNLFYKYLENTKTEDLAFQCDISNEDNVKLIPLIETIRDSYINDDYIIDNINTENFIYLSSSALSNISLNLFETHSNRFDWKTIQYIKCLGSNMGFILRNLDKFDIKVIENICNFDWDFFFYDLEDIIKIIKDCGDIPKDILNNYLSKSEDIFDNYNKLCDSYLSRPKYMINIIDNSNEYILLEEDGITALIREHNIQKILKI